jgi:hypothetical protein
MHTEPAPIATLNGGFFVPTSPHFSHCRPKLTPQFGRHVRPKLGVSVMSWLLAWLILNAIIFEWRILVAIAEINRESIEANCAPA